MKEYFKRNIKEGGLEFDYDAREVVNTISLFISISMKKMKLTKS